MLQPQEQQGLAARAWPLQVLVALWGAGVAASLARLVAGIARANRIRANAREVASAHVASACRELCAAMGVRGAPQVLEAEEGRPLLIGALRPAIVLPRDLLGAGEADSRLILAHEIAHIKRRDLVWNLALALISALFWFHPALWLARRESLLAQEMACDEAALRATGAAPASYARVLVRVAEGVAPPVLAGAAGVVSRRSTLPARVAALASATASTRRARIAVAVAIPLAAVSLLPWRVVAQAPVARPVALATPVPTPLPATGVVAVGRVPVEGAGILLEGPDGGEPRAVLRSGAGGRFVIPGKYLARPVRLWAARGRLAMRESIVVSAGQRSFWLFLEEDALVGFSVRVTDTKSGAPIPGARVTLHAKPRAGSGEFAYRQPTRVTGRDGRVSIVVRRDGAHSFDFRTEVPPRFARRPFRVAPDVQNWGAVVTRIADLTRIRSAVPAAAGREASGTVIGPDGAPVEGAGILLEGLGDEPRDKYPRAALKSDASGRFVVDAKYLRRPVRLWARKGSLAMARPIVAVAGDSLTLSLRADALAGATVRVVEAGSRRPIAGARVRVHYYNGSIGSTWDAGTTGGDGRVRIARRRADGEYGADVTLPTGYEEQVYSVLPPLRPGSEIEHAVEVRPARATVAGRVIGEDGRPAAGLVVRADGAREGVLTQSDGRFEQAGVLAGPLSLNVWDGRRSIQWTNFRAVGGRRDAVVRLARAARRDHVWRQPRQPRRVPPSRVGAELPAPVSVGAMAPPLTASGWVNSAPLSAANLRGRVVLLQFLDWRLGFLGRTLPQVQSVADRLQPRGALVIGVHAPSPLESTVRSEIRSARPSASPAEIETRAARAMAEIGFDISKLRGLAQQHGLSFPIALDVPVAGAPRLDVFLRPPGVTGRGFGSPTASRIVINRAGRVAYVGNSLPDALQAAEAALASSGGR